MDRDTPSEVTPLLQHENGNRSNSNLLPTDIPSQNNITFYGRPCVPSSITSYHSNRHPQDNYHQRTRSQRSDSFSLATLATDKKMSDPRRTFCLFVTFDFLFTFILWLIEIGVSSSSSNSKMDFFDILHLQIVGFAFHTSLFDIVIIAFARFMFLEITYGLFRIRHWWPVACSTAVSDAALIAKIFAIFIGFSKNPSSQTLDIPTAVVLLLADFILTWIEVWFIDFKVLPAETKLAHRTAQAFLHNHSYQSLPPGDNSVLRLTPAGTSGPASYFEAGRFYSPAATPPASEGGFTGVESMYYSMRGAHSRFAPPWSNKNSRLVQQGKTALNRLWGMYKNENIWREEKRMENGDVVFSTETDEFGKSFKLVATIIGRTPNVIQNEIILKPEDFPVWNKSIADVKILQQLDEHTCISREVSCAVAMGLIASREFVTVRRIEIRGDVFVNAGVSTDQCEDIVPKSTLIRAVNGPSGFIIAPCLSEPLSSTFTWILNTDLKGNLNRTLVNSNLAKTMTDFTAALRGRLLVAC